MFRPLRFTNTSVVSLLGLAAALMTLGSPARAAQEYVDDTNRYPILNKVGLDEKLDAMVPGDVSFRDLQDQPVQLGDLFNGERSIVLTLNYATCPKLCGLQVKGLAESLSQSNLIPGVDFDLITISLDPDEKAEAAKLVLQGFLKTLGQPADSTCWQFLRGPEANIRQVADSVGYRYAYDEKSEQYAHPPTAMVLSPDGKVCRYISGFNPDPTTLRLAIKEASLGQSGSTFDKLLFFCFSFDSSTGKYTLAAWRLLRTGGVLTVVFLITGIWMLQRSRAREVSQ